MASNFDRFLADILGPVAPQIQQASQGMDPRLVGQIMQAAVQDGVQGVNRYNEQPAQPQVPVQSWTPTPQTPQQIQAAPMQGPVPNPNAEYRPPSDPQQIAPEAAPDPMPQAGRTTEGYAPAGTPLSEDEGYVAVEIMVPGENGSLQPHRFMVPEHYVADGAPEGVTVFGGGQVTPAAQVPDEVKLENQPDPIRWMFTDARDAATNEARNTPGSPEAIAEMQGNAPTTGRELTDQQAADVALQNQGVMQGPEAPPEPESYSVEEIADETLRNSLIASGYSTIRDDQYPLTNPDTGQVRLVTQQEIIDENLPVPVEWMYEDPAFVQQLKDAGITSMRLDQMPVMDNGVIKLAPVPETSNRELPGQELPPVTPDFLAQYDPAIAAEMRSAGIDEIPDGMVLTRGLGDRLVVAPATRVEAEDVIFYGGQSSLPDPGIFRDTDGNIGNPMELIGVGAQSVADIANIGLGVLGNVTGRDVQISDSAVENTLMALDVPRQVVAEDVGNRIYQDISGNDVDMRGPDWLSDAFAKVTPTATSGYGDMYGFYRENPELMEQLFTEGYDVDGDGVPDFTGGRALWEYHVGNEQGLANQIIGELIMDPLNVLPAGVGLRGAANVIRGAGTGPLSIPRRVAGDALDLVGKAMQFADEAPGRALLSPVRAVTNRPVTATNVPRRFGDSRAPVDMQGVELQRGEYTGPIGRVLNPSEGTQLERETEPYTRIVGDATGEGRANLEARGIGIDPEDTPPGALPDPETPPPGPNAPSRQAVQQPLDDAPVTRPEDEVVARDSTPQQRDEAIRAADEGEPPATTIDTTGPDVPPSGPELPADPGDGIPSPTSRDWGNFAPREDGDYFISRLWQTRDQYPARWRSFFTDVNERLREYNQRRHVTNQRSRQIREAQGEGARDFDGAMLDAVDDYEVLIDVYEAAQRSYGDVADIRHTFSNQYRTGTSRSGKTINYYGQTDAYYIERAIFGTGRQSANAMEQLRYKAREMNNTALQSELPRIMRLRREWEGMRTRPGNAPVAQTRLAGNDEFEMGIARTDEIRTTRNMTPEQMREAGLPVKDFQNRTQDFAERTVTDMVDNYQSASMRPIQVVRGTDNNLYVLDGHSRLEAFRRLNREEIPIQVVRGSEGEIARAADIANVSGTANTPIDQGRIAQRRIDAGESPADVASAMKVSRREMDNMLALRHLDPESELGRAVDAGQLDVARAAPIGRTIGDERLTMAEADAFYRSVVVPNDLTVRQITDEVSALYKFKVAESDGGNTLFDMSETVSDSFWQARARAAEVRKEIARLRRERNNFTKVGKSTKLSREQKARIREFDQQIADLQGDEVAAESAARDAFYGEGDTTPPMPDIDGEPLLRPMTEADAAARQVDDVAEEAAPSPSAAMEASGATRLFSSAVPGGPQVSALLTDPETGKWRRVRNPNAGGRLDPERQRTESMLSVNDALESTRRTFLSDDFGIVSTHNELVALGRRVGPDADSPTALDLWRDYYQDELTIRAEQGGLWDGVEPPASVQVEALERAGQRMIQDVYADSLRKINPKKYEVYRKAIDDILEKDPDADMNTAHVAALREANEKTSRVPEAYDTYLSIQREIRLYNPITGTRYVMTQAVGNTITSLLGAGIVRGTQISRSALGETARDVAVRFSDEGRQGLAARGAMADLRGGKSLADWTAPLDDPGTIRRMALEEEAATPGITLDASDQFMVQVGLFENPTVLRVPREEGMGLRASGELAQETMTKRWLEKRRWTKPLTRGSGILASETVREIANAFDLAFRKSTFVERMQANIQGAKPQFAEYARAALPEGIDPARFDEAWNSLPEYFSDNHLRQAFADIDPGYAERIGRDWRSSLRNMERDADAEVNRLFFSGQELKGDAALRRIIMFHYWMSRATPLYTASLMKHVGLMTNYVQMMQELKEQSEPYGKAVSGMLKVFDSILGFNIFIRPDSMLQTVMALGGYEGGFDPENESGLVKFLRESGLFFNPGIMSALNYAGLSGDTFAPDPFSLQTHAAFVTTGIDLLKSVLPGADKPTRNMYQEFNSWLRSETSRVGEPFDRERIPFQRSDQFGMIEVNNLIMDIAEERGMEWDDPQDQAKIVAAMSDPESELYQAAFNRYAQANFSQQVLRILPTAVLYPKLRSAGKDERSLTIRTTNRSDPANQEARDQRDYAQITDPDVRELRIQQDEYQRLGPEEGREAYRTYNAIRFGPLQTPIVYNGVAISERQLRTMDGDERKAVADQWAEQTGVAASIEEVRELRKQYRERHPEYTRYYDWQITVSDAEGGAQGYWENVLVPNNPNARRYYEGLDEQETGDLERDLTSVEAFFAAEGRRPTGYDPDPLPTGVGNPATTVGDLGLGQGYGQTEYDPAQAIREDLADYYSQADAVDAQIKAIFGENASLDAIMQQPPTWRDGYLDRLEREGVEVPRLGRNAQAYIEWAEAQPQGADVGVDAYIAWREATEGEATVSPEDAEQRVRMGLGR